MQISDDPSGSAGELTNFSLVSFLLLFRGSSFMKDFNYE
jgi:hypothetical protein